MWVGVCVCMCPSKEVSFSHCFQIQKEERNVIFNTNIIYIRAKFFHKWINVFCSKSYIVVHLREEAVATGRSYCVVSSAIYFIRCLECLSIPSACFCTKDLCPVVLLWWSLSFEDYNFSLQVYASCFPTSLCD